MRASEADVEMKDRERFMSVGTSFVLAIFGSVPVRGIIE